MIHLIRGPIGGPPLLTAVLTIRLECDRCGVSPPGPPAASRADRLARDRHRLRSEARTWNGWRCRIAWPPGTPEPYRLDLCPGCAPGARIPYSRIT